MLMETNIIFKRLIGETDFFGVSRNQRVEYSEQCGQLFSFRH